MRRGKLSEDQRHTALDALQTLRVRLDYEMSAIAFTKLALIATEFGLSVYDAAYFELAQRRQLPLACKDGPLRAAAARAHLEFL